MSPFEYISVLISIILGMGITQLLTGIADMIHQWKKIKIYWPHLLWVSFVFFLHLQDWWVTFDLQKHTSWRLSTFLFYILYPINLFIMARLLFPFGAMESVDFKKFYQDNYRKIFLWTIFLNILTIADNLVNAYPVSYQIIPVAIMIVLTTIVIRKIETEWLHKAIVIALLGLLLTVLFLFDFEIGVN